MIVHCGDAVLVVGAGGGERWLEPAVHDGFVYAGASPRPRPASGPAAVADVHELLELIRSWAWSRPAVDPWLLLGWVGCAVLGAALIWRPTVWISGGSGTGKSTLKDHLLEPLFGQDGVVSVMDTSEAALRQKLRQASLPAIVDELEAAADNRRVEAIVRLARLASSGGKITRGGKEHQEVVFELRSAMLFQSILIPPLGPQDRNRVAVLELEPLGDRPPPPLPVQRLGEIGAAIRRRMVDAWPRLGDAIERHQEAMRAPAVGEGTDSGDRPPMDARGAAVYGTLAAVAELLLYDDREETDGAFRALPEALRRRVAAEREGTAEEEEFLDHVLSSSIEPIRGAPALTVAEMIRRIAYPSPMGDEDNDVPRHRRTLGLHGLFIGPYTGEVERLRGRMGIAIANRSDGLAKLLAGTRWSAGAGKSPPWVQVAKRLAQLHGGVPSPSTCWNFAGFRARGAWIPVAALESRLGDGTP